MPWELYWGEKNVILLIAEQNILVVLKGDFWGFDDAQRPEPPCWLRLCSPGHYDLHSLIRCYTSMTYMTHLLTCLTFVTRTSNFDEFLDVHSCLLRCWLGRCLLGFLRSSPSTAQKKYDVISTAAIKPHSDMVTINHPYPFEAWSDLFFS